MSHTDGSKMPEDAHSGRHSSKDMNVYGLTEIAFQNAGISVLDKLESFHRFTTKRSMARFMAQERIFEKVMNTNGLIVDCGVLNGAGLITWAKLYNIKAPFGSAERRVGD